MSLHCLCPLLTEYPVLDFPSTCVSHFLSCLCLSHCLHPYLITSTPLSASLLSLSLYAHRNSSTEPEEMASQLALSTWGRLSRGEWHWL